MRHLPPRMYPRICATRCANRVAAGFEFCQRRLDLALHADVRLLPLPANKGRAVVFNFECISGHGVALSAQGGLRQCFSPLVTGRVRPYPLSIDMNFEAAPVVISTRADGIIRTIEGARDTVNEDVVRTCDPFGCHRLGALWQDCVYHVFGGESFGPGSYGAASCGGRGAHCGGLPAAAAGRHCPSF